MIFTSAANYIDSCQSIREKIAAIDAIISALLTTAANSAVNDNINEYWLNDGQTQIKTIYKGTHQVYTSIQNFRRLRQEYISQLTGRVSVFMDSKNFNGNGGR